ncbi:MAG: uroporphyrinogen decarboxylase family protein [Tissierellia bacterium]|nr:uroporphyrinogen decarboxylase family protein [Tissierellia bacterium]
MNKRQRFIHYLNNEPVDRVPLAFYHHFLGPKMLYNMNQGLSSQKAYQANIEGHRRAREAFDPDMVKIMNDSLMIMPLEGAQVKRPQDLSRVLPQTKDSRWTDLSIHLAQEVKKIYSDSQAPVFYTSFGPAYILRSNLARIGNLMAGSPFFEKRILRFMAEDKEAMKDLVMRVSEAVIEINQRLFEEVGIDGIYFSVNNQNDFFPQALYREVFSPGDKRILEAANQTSPMNLLHICGYRDKANDLSSFADYPAGAYNWAVHAEGVSLKEGKALFGDRPVFGGFKQKGLIPYGSQEEIEEAVFKLLDETGQRGIMLGADCTLPTDFDDGRLNMVRAACQAYAKVHG